MRFAYTETMTITVEMQHTYNSPVEVVAAVHLTKYPNKYDPNVKSCSIIERKRDITNNSTYTKRIAHCKNVLPSILRKVNILFFKLELFFTWIVNF